ncbi:MAG: glutathione S-transferase, partial [Gammaproteobacteria bacterium]
DAMLPDPLHPSNACDRARARQIQAWLRRDFNPIRAERPTEVLFYDRENTPLSDLAKGSALRLLDDPSALVSNQTDHLYRQWRIADLDVAIMLNLLVTNGDSVPAPLVEYAARQ